MIPFISPSDFHIGKACAVLGMVDQEYRKQPGLTQSALNLFNQSPALYAYAPPQETHAMRLGRALHAKMLTDQEDYVVKPSTYGPDQKPWHGGAKECKQWMEDNAHRTILSLEEHTEITNAVRHAMKHELVAHLIRGAYTEVSIFGVDQKGVPWGKGRLDAIQCRGDHIQIIDVKTTQDATLGGFSRSIYQRGYHRQAAWYVDLVSQFIDPKVRVDYWLIALEVSPLPRVNVWKLAPEAVQVGREENEKLIDLHIECSSTGYWPDFHKRDVGLLGMIDLPKWVYEREQELEGMTVAKDNA